MMNKIEKELEVLKSWGIESIPMDKVLSLIEGDDVTLSFPFGDQITVIPREITTTAPVGGTIFYIDEDVDDIYEFFDVDGNLIENVQIGDKPYAYRVVKKDPRNKYYVYHDEVYDNLRWTYYKNGNYVYEVLDTPTKMCSGRKNTRKIIEKDNEAYTTLDFYGFPTIWCQLQQIRNTKVGGCDDWFVPSKNEIEFLRLAIVSGRITGGTIAKDWYDESEFTNKRFWSSSEASSLCVWNWCHHRQRWETLDKSNCISVFFTRSF